MAGFYVGIAKCGCVRAGLVDDEKTTAKEIADFARRQASMKRRMEHVPEGQHPWTLNPDCVEHANPTGLELALSTPPKEPPHDP